MRSAVVYVLAAVGNTGTAMPLRRVTPPADTVSVHQRARAKAISAEEAAACARLVPDYIVAARATYKTPEEAFNAADKTYKTPEDPTQDGRISVPEWNAESAKLKLDVTTTAALAPGWTAFQEMDVDGDRYVSRREFYQATAKNVNDGKEWQDKAPVPGAPAFDDTDYKQDDPPKRSAACEGSV